MLSAVHGAAPILAKGAPYSAEARSSLPNVAALSELLGGGQDFGDACTLLVLAYEKLGLVAHRWSTTPVIQEVLAAEAEPANPPSVAPCVVKRHKTTKHATKRPTNKKG